MIAPLVAFRPRTVPVSVVLGLSALTLVAAVVALRMVQTPADHVGSVTVPAWSEGVGAPAPGDLVVAVGPGETLWSIAARLAPGDDPRPVVEALAVVNGGTDLRVGQRLVIPAPLVGQAMP